MIVPEGGAEAGTHVVRRRGAGVAAPQPCPTFTAHAAQTGSKLLFKSNSCFTCYSMSFSDQRLELIYKIDIFYT